MSRDAHYRNLERLYREAPVTQWFGTTVVVGDGVAEVRLDIRRDFLHAGGAVHGSVLFRLLDDAAYFAANSQVDDYLVLTVTLNTSYLRPVQSGTLVGRGRVVRAGKRMIFADSEVFKDDTLIARATGTFTASELPLSSLPLT